MNVYMIYILGLGIKGKYNDCNIDLKWRVYSMYVFFWW